MKITHWEGIKLNKFQRFIAEHPFHAAAFGIFWMCLAIMQVVI